jgi:hypothetical protein
VSRRILQTSGQPISAKDFASLRLIQGAMGLIQGAVEKSASVDARQKSCNNDSYV